MKPCVIIDVYPMEIRDATFNVERDFKNVCFFAVSGSSLCDGSVIDDIVHCMWC